MNASDIDRSIGERIRLCRESQGISQEELAQRAGMDRTAIGKIERAERSVRIQTLFRLASALQTTASKLLSGLE